MNFFNKDFKFKHFAIVFLLFLFIGAGTGTYLQFANKKWNSDGDETQLISNGSEIAGFDSSVQGLYLRSTQQGLFHFSTNDLEIENTNVNTPIILRSDLGIQGWNNNGASSQYFNLDSTTGLVLMVSNMQVKTPQDTVSDYDTDDAVSLSRQICKITTKSLTTAAGSSYTLTVTNAHSLTSSTWITTLNTTSSTGLPYIKADGGSLAGTIVVTIYNIAGAAAFNNTITFTLATFNKP